jgi:hypothetical protein
MKKIALAAVAAFSLFSSVAFGDDAACTFMKDGHEHTLQVSEQDCKELQAGNFDAVSDAAKEKLNAPK